MGFIEVSGTPINPNHIVFVEKRDLEENDIYYGSENLMKLVVSLTDKSEISVIADVDSVCIEFDYIKSVLKYREII